MYCSVHFQHLKDYFFSNKFLSQLKRLGSAYGKEWLQSSYYLVKKFNF